jgi:hypothetical protein
VSHEIRGRVHDDRRGLRLVPARLTPAAQIAPESLATPEKASMRPESGIGISSRLRSRCDGHMAFLPAGERQRLAALFTTPLRARR